MGFPLNLNAQTQAGDPLRGAASSNQNFGRMTQSQQQQLFEKLNKIYEE